MSPSPEESGEGCWDWREEFPDLGEDPVPSLIVKLGDENPKVRWKAAWALGHLGDARAVDPLIASLDFSRPYASGEDAFTLNMVAAWALGKLEDPRAVEPLIRALSNACDDFVWIAAWALGEIGDTRAIAPLRAALEQGGFECVWAPGRPSPPEEFLDRVEFAVLDCITRMTFHAPETPIERALEKLGAVPGQTANPP
jgi:hypothetical protein